MDSLGDRMKSYELAWRSFLTPNSFVFVRVDGRAFHAFTRKAACGKPFDKSLHDAMVAAAVETVQDIAGCKLAYTQSDECSFVLTDFDSHDTVGWFGYNQLKLASIIASGFTMRFNRAFSGGSHSAMFDARAYVVPDRDAANVLVWRQQDWRRNSITMAAQARFTPRELHGKTQADMLEMLSQVGKPWTDCEDWQRNGTFVYPDGRTSSETLVFEDLVPLITPGMRFRRYIEIYDDESEIPNFWLQTTGNEAALAELERTLAGYREDYLAIKFMLTDDELSSRELDILTRYTCGNCPQHTRVSGQLVLPDGFGQQPQGWRTELLYKGGIESLFKNIGATDGSEF